MTADRARDTIRRLFLPSRACFPISGIVHRGRWKSRVPIPPWKVWLVLTITTTVSSYPTNADALAATANLKHWSLKLSEVRPIYAGPTAKDEPMDELRINHTTFRIPKKYVGYYDKKTRSVLGMHFLLPSMTPIEPFSIGVVGKHKPGQVADVGIQANKWPDPGPFLDRLAAQGKLQTIDYGFGLQEVPPSLLPGPTQNQSDPDIREFLGTLIGQRVAIDCSGFRLGGCS